MNFLFIFLDGVGLGLPDPIFNPFAQAEMPNLENLLGGRKLVKDSAPYNGQRASLLTLDACLGVPGLPQSATGQASLLTGINVSAALGYHYGPKPNPAVAEFLTNGNIFKSLAGMDKQARFLNAYPPGYFQSIASSRRIYSAIPLAVTHAGLPLYDMAALQRGEALSADFTSQGWRDHLGLNETQVISAEEAGKRLAILAQQYDFSFFEFWLSDYAGHRQDMSGALQLLTTFDQVLGGLINAWDDKQGLILITSDHGNLEDLSTRRHTMNPVPALVIGGEKARRAFIRDMKNLADIAPAILGVLQD